ncbi:hypothetical protein [Methanocaldococcus sp.]
MVFDIIRKFEHSKELNKAVDEIFVGEIINYMYKNDAYLVDIISSESSHFLSFRFKNNFLYMLNISLDRKVEGLASKIIGSQSVMSIEAIIRRELVEPEDVIKMIETDLKNIFKIPMFGNVKIDHNLNYIIAKTSYIIDLNKFIKDKEVKKEEIREEIDKIIKTLVESLKNL